MEAAKNTYKLVNGNGDTYDIVKEVMACYRDTYEQCRVLAADLKGATDADTCRNVFDFVHKHIKYKEDPNGQQWVKTPARLLADKVGDCKSFSIFINSVLTCAGIDCFFRFVSYAAGDFTHVYPVAVVDGKNIYLDVVATVLRGTPYNQELKFKSNKDYDMSGTRIARLAGLGSTDLTVFTGNNPTPKMNIMELYTNIDLLEAKASITASMLDLEAIYNQQEIYYMIIRLIEKYGNNRANLELAGYVMAKAIDDKAFAETFANMDDRKEYMDALFVGICKQIDELINPLNATQYQIKESYIQSVSSFIEYWKNTILANNIEVKSKVSGIGTTTADWAAMVKNSAPYFLYSTQANPLDAKAAERKRQYTNNLLNWLITNNTGLTKSAIDNLLRSGIITKMGAHPETVIGAMRTKKIAGIGDIYDDMFNEYEVPLGNTNKESTYDKVISSINQISTAVASVAKTVYAVQSVFGKGDATGPNTSNLYDYTPTMSDWTSSSLVSTIGFGALGLGAFFLLTKKKDKESSNYKYNRRR